MMNVQESQKIIISLQNEIHKGIVGQKDFVEGLVTGLLADGHVLIEGVPGLAKTRAVNLLAKSCDLAFKRIQFTPDLLPADIVGTRIYNQGKGSFETSLGPVFANFIIADEINRAPSKVQSALLETMQERQVTIGDKTHKLPSPFCVYATMNPIEQEGTYLLPEAQLDRFIVKLVVDYPTKVEENEIVRMIIQETSLPEVNKAVDSNTILKLQELVRTIYIDDKLIQYITDIVFATRFPDKYGIQLKNMLQIGASPRASISMAQASRAKALISGRNSVYPEDIKSIALNVLRHRIILTYHAEAEGKKPDELIQEILDKIKVP